MKKAPSGAFFACEYWHWIRMLSAHVGMRSEAQPAVPTYLLGCGVMRRYGFNSL